MSVAKSAGNVCRLNSANNFSVILAKRVSFFQVCQLGLLNWLSAIRLFVRAKNGHLMDQFVGEVVAKHGPNPENTNAPHITKIYLQKPI